MRHGTSIFWNFYLCNFSVFWFNFLSKLQIMEQPPSVWPFSVNWWQMALIFILKQMHLLRFIPFYLFVAWSNFLSKLQWWTSPFLSALSLCMVTNAVMFIQKQMLFIISGINWYINEEKIEVKDTMIGPKLMC